MPAADVEPPASVEEPPPYEAAASSSSSSVPPLPNRPAAGPSRYSDNPQSSRPQRHSDNPPSHYPPEKGRPQPHAQVPSGPPPPPRPEPERHPFGYRYPPGYWCPKCHNTGIKLRNGKKCGTCERQFHPSLFAPPRPAPMIQPVAAVGGGFFSPPMGVMPLGPPGIVVRPGDPRIGGMLCGYCGGDGRIMGFMFMDEMCPRCRGTGRVF
ncbi:hypothetical protein YB2330_000986 [Saitoella coloradoensis]